MIFNFFLWLVQNLWNLVHILHVAAHLYLVPHFKSQYPYVASGYYIGQCKYRSLMVWLCVTWRRSPGHLHEEASPWQV